MRTPPLSSCIKAVASSEAAAPPSHVFHSKLRIAKLIHANKPRDKAPWRESSSDKEIVHFSQLEPMGLMNPKTKSKQQHLRNSPHHALKSRHKVYGVGVTPKPRGHNNSSELKRTNIDAPLRASDECLIHVNNVYLVDNIETTYFFSN
jgi:hypothetical protein